MFGSRVKATPVPDVSPMLPKTIACTLTAVPFRPVMRSMRRILDRFLAVPRIEDGVDRQHELLDGILREIVRRRACL